jgi:anti-sigma B factor antagonist
MFDIETSDTRRGRVVRLQGEFDLAALPQAEKVFGSALGNAHEAVEVDLRGLSFIDSSGIRLLVQVLERSKADGTELTLIPGPREVQRVFEVTELADRMPFEHPHEGDEPT